MIGILGITALLVIVFVLSAFAHDRNIYVIPGPNDTLQPIAEVETTPTPEPTHNVEPTGEVTSEPTATVGWAPTGISVPTMSRRPQSSASRN